jgi:DNA-directed RNA polymerase specialized sigma24 family protein
MLSAPVGGSITGGDAVADDDFDDFYAGSYDRLLRQLYVVTGGDLAEAEDVLQEAYARALARWRTIGRYDAPEAWVRRVAVNLAGMAARRVRSRAKALLRLGGPGQVDELSPDALDLAAALQQVPLVPPRSARGRRRSRPGWPGAGQPWPAGSARRPRR